MSTFSGSPLAVLTYNVSYEAMTNNSGGSAGTLGRQCVPVSSGSRLTICAQNMATAIDAMPGSLDVPGFDFAGLQESSRVDELKRASGVLGRMEMVESRSVYAHMASFYNPERYECYRFMPGALSDGRPFHILYCRRLDGDGGVIFINLHNAHRRSFNWIESQLSAEHEGLDDKPMHEALSDDEKAYRIIAVGDYNEAGWDWDRRELVQKTWTPLKGTGIDTEVSIKTYAYTCCKGNGDWVASGGGLAKGHQAGDYIFDSVAPAEAHVPTSYDPADLQSDHLPVVARL